MTIIEEILKTVEAPEPMAVRERRQKPDPTPIASTT